MTIRRKMPVRGWSQYAETTLGVQRLERLTMEVQTRMSADFMLDSVTVRDEPSLMGIADDLVITARAHAYTFVEQSGFAQYPLNWQEAIKERFAPQFIKRRWPVRYHQTVLELEKVGIRQPPTLETGTSYRVNVRSCITTDRPPARRKESAP